MPPLMLAAILAGAGSLYKGGMGAWQLHKANQFARTPRPDYTIPDSITANQSLAQSAYDKSFQQGLPGEGQLYNKLNVAQAGTNAAISRSQYSPVAAAAAMAAGDANTKNAIVDLGVKAAQYRQNNINAMRTQLYGENNLLAQYRDKAWDWNRAQPYKSAMATASALRNAGYNNLNSAITGLTDIASNVAIRGGFGGGKVANPAVTTTATPTNIATGGLTEDPVLAQLRVQYPWLTDEQIQQQILGK